MKRLLIILILAFLCSCVNQEKNTHTPLAEEYNLYKPQEFIIDAFKKNEVIFLGENHWIKEEVDFIKKIIPILNQNDINILFSEFVSYSDTMLVDSLLNAEHFDDDLAREITSRSLYEWAYQEYVDVLRVAWEVNQKSEKPFNIIGLAKDFNYAVIQNQEDLNQPEKRKEFFVESECDWADRIIARTIQQNEKALVYCGAHHSISHYVQPIVVNGEYKGKVNPLDRVGQCVYNKYPEKTMTIWMHHPWMTKNTTDEKKLSPMQSYFDNLIDSLPSDYKSYAFYTNESILGSIIDSTSYYSCGYDNFNLSNLCHGYIVLKPLCNLNLASFINDFINESSIEHVQEQVRAWEGIENISIQSINDTLEIWYNDKIETFNMEKQKFCR